MNTKESSDATRVWPCSTALASHSEARAACQQCFVSYASVA